MSAFGVPTDKHLTKINSFAKKTLSSDEVFVYPHKMAGDMIIPERFIQLTPPLLDVFARDANNGVAFLLDHSWSGFARPKPALPYGRVFEGEVSQNGIVKGETVSFNGSTYIVRGQEKDGIKTDAIISDIETGVLFDTSIGWGANKFECSICGNDIRDYRKCEHFPGKMYVINEDTGESKLCWAMAKPPGYLMEDSGVFDGAYPGAGTSLNSLGMNNFGNESGEISAFEDFKRIPMDAYVFGTYSKRGGILTFAKKTDYRKSFSVTPGLSETINTTRILGRIIGNSFIAPMKGCEKPMLNEEKAKEMLSSFGITLKEENQLEEIFSQMIIKWDTVVQAIKDSAAPSAQLELTSFTPEFLTQAQAKEKLGTEASADEVLRLAKEGWDYHKHTVDDAIAMGVKAQGNDFPAETWKNTFAAMSTQAIKDIAKTFEAQAKAGIPTGRLSDLDDVNETWDKSDVPDEAYKA